MVRVASRGPDPGAAVGGWQRGGAAGDEVGLLHEQDVGLWVDLVYTRRVPPGWEGPVGRLDAARLATLAWPRADRPACFVCGPTSFAEAVANLLVDQGYAPERIKTERL